MIVGLPGIYLVNPINLYTNMKPSAITVAGHFALLYNRLKMHSIRYHLCVIFV